MATLTLEQLKAENAPEGEETEELSPETEVEELEVAAEETEEETEEAGESTEEETTEEPVEAWQQTEGQTSDDQQKKGPSFRGLKLKLKATIGKRDDEIAELRAQVNALTKGTAQTQPQTAQPNPRPKREDFSLDDEGYDEAVDKWNDAKLDARFASHTQQQSQTQAVNTQQAEIEKAVDRHYEGAAKLVAEGKVTEDQYRNADEVVRSAIESVMNGQGDIISDFLISRLNGSGDGSEKVWFHLGRNTEALTTLKNKIANDPNGIDAAMYLGELRAKLTSDPVKRVSQAPKPGSRIKGDAKKVTGGALLKKYKKAGDDVQLRINLKREAKANGEDVSNW